MNAYRLETTIDKAHTLLLTQLPFEEGEQVEVIVLQRASQQASTLNRDGQEDEDKFWQALTQPSLQELWDNEKDAIYDRF